MLRHFNRLLITAVLVLTSSSASWAQFIQLNGKRVLCDQKRGLWLCSIAEDNFGHDYEAVVTFDSTLVALNINGQEVCDSANVVLPDINADTKLPITATLSDSTTLEGNLQFTFLPIIEYGGKFNKTTFVTVPFNIMRPDDTDIFALADIRYRGSLTYYNAPEKRSYRVKFVDENGEKLDMKLFNGLRTDNSWVLDGGGADLIRIRNYVSAGLWNDMATKPYYAADEPKALTAMRGQLVETFRDGEYVGLYNMCEPIDRKQMRLKKYDSETLAIHGQLWKADNRSEYTLMNTCAKSLPSGNNTAYNYFETKYPDMDEVKPTNYKVLHELLKLCAKADDETFAAQISNRLDIPAVIDHYIFLEVLLAFDNEGKNIYWGCYDRTKSEKLTPAVWDMDVAFGQDWKNTNLHSNRVQPWTDLMQGFINHHRFLYRLFKLDVDNFNQKVNDRYHELRENELTTESLIERFTSVVDMLKRSGTAQREEWRHAPDMFSKQNINFDEELQYIVNWIPRRMEYLDNYVFVEHRVRRGDINDDGFIDIADVNGIINMILEITEATPIGDFNYDSKIDVEDVSTMINYILGLDY